MALPSCSSSAFGQLLSLHVSPVLISLGTESKVRISYESRKGGSSSKQDLLIHNTNSKLLKGVEKTESNLKGLTLKVRMKRLLYIVHII